MAKRLNLACDDPISLLLGHSIELILKASILHLGAPEKEAWGHDLVKLRALAIEKGCAFIIDQTQEGHLKLLNNGFGTPPYEVRYLVTGFVTVHDDFIILRIADRFADEATKLIPGAIRNP